MTETESERKAVNYFTDNAGNECGGMRKLIFV